MDGSMRLCRMHQIPPPPPPPPRTRNGNEEGGVKQLQLS